MKAQNKVISVRVAAVVALALSGSAGAGAPVAVPDSQIQSSSAPMLYLASEAGHTTAPAAGATTQEGAAATTHGKGHTTAEEAAVEGTVHSPQGKHSDTEQEEEGAHQGTTQRPAQ